MKLEFVLIPESEKTRAELRPGYYYVVLYWDCHRQKQRTTIGRWNGDSQDFDYRPQKFVRPEVKPSFKKEQNRHHIIGWIDICRWRMPGDDAPLHTIADGPRPVL